jgi:hypothetical protein
MRESDAADGISLPSATNSRWPRDRNICSVGEHVGRVTSWEETAGGLRAVDSDGATTVTAPDWQPVGDGGTDQRRVGDATSLRFPDGPVALRDGDTGERVTVDGETELTGGAFVLDVASQPWVTALFDAPAAVTDGDDGITVSFLEPSRVELRADTGTRAPAETVTVPATIDGLAVAVTHAAAAHRTMGPERSLQANRRHPPAVSFGPDFDVPDAVAAATPDTGIEVVLPRTKRAVFVAAPLAFYLGARVGLARDADPRLVAPEAGVDCSLAPLESSVPDVLARVFWLDCLVRDADTGLREAGALADLGLDAAALRERSPAGRLAASLDAPFERVGDRFPEWHLTMHVDPEFGNATTLPHLLDRLALVFPPETADLDREELVSRSLDDFYRGAPGPVASVEMLDPRDRPGRVQGWLADGTPVDASKTHPAAYRNHQRYRRAGRDEMSVAVVLNDESMSGEHDAVADIYDARADERPMDVSFHRDLTRDELRGVLGERHEFLHYIGHCEVDGLRCADGNLAVADLDETNVETFFLNACGSYYEGLGLVERGSVAGAVTLRKVLDEQAAKVGTAFARLLLGGFPIQSALTLARRRIRMGKDYAVVGDGTQTLSGTDDGDARVAYVDAVGDDGDWDGERNGSGDRYEVSLQQRSLARHGDAFDVPAVAGGGRRLAGNAASFTAAATDLATLFDAADLPVVLDGRFHWADEAAARLRASARATD